MSMLHGAAMLVAVLHAVSASAQNELTYADILATYRAGEYEAAVRAVKSLSSRAMEDEERLLARTPTGMVRDADIRAAMLLHAEAHFAAVSSELAGLDSRHLDRAQRLARGYLRGREKFSDAREFVRQWFLLLVAHFHGVRHVNRSADYLREARSLFPDDPEVLLASGSHHELLALIERVSFYDRMGNRTREQRVDRGEELSEAARYFRAATAANAQLDEAHLRLGRVLYEAGDLKAASQSLETVRTRRRDEALTYLAAIFLALVEEQRGDRARAARLYVEAMKLFPDAQAPLVGVSELLYVDGHPDDAATTSATLLERPAPRDPWWVYMLGEWWRFDVRLASLRAQVRE